MNQILELKGKFNQAPASRRPSTPTLPPKTSVNISDIERLLVSLYAVKQYWIRERPLFKPLVSVYYRDIVAKSNRMGALLTERPSDSPNDTVVGAKFSNEPQPRHIITHCCELSFIDSAIEQLKKVRAVVLDVFDSEILAETMDILNVNVNRLKRNLSDSEKGENKRRERVLATQGLSKSQFCRIIRDIYYIDYFGVQEQKKSISENQIITLYDIGLPQDEIIRRLGLQNEYIRTLDSVTWLVTPNQYMKIIDKAPYLIAMAVADFGRIDALVDGCKHEHEFGFLIGEPKDEPVIGVIDTLFDQNAYFSAWVDYHCMVNADLIEQDDFVHGTAISSLIVDGPALNPSLEDGCGRFRVRHFGIAKHRKNSTASLMQALRSIVETNKDIKVWNFSLGSPLEIEQNFISPEAALLDKLQVEQDVIFVIAGTNNRNRHKNFPKIGAPADSINSLVVNSASLLGKPVEYGRKGPVLYFYRKPDVSFFGGDRLDSMVVYSSQGRMKEMGTSFAAPWIARKLAYLIHVMGFSREIAKALIIDSAAGWSGNNSNLNLLGFGVVPTHIKDILTSQDNEIRFVVQGISEAYETYTYSIPVPMFKEQFPYVAKATLCYFPKCSRFQGVDYTDTEMDIQFGRIKQGGRIKSIDNNKQGDDEPQPLFEKVVRAKFRKWDNVKHISEGVPRRARPRKRLSQSSSNWGISIKTKERHSVKSGRGLRFGLVVTLREITGVNRISEFMQLCRANNWFVDEVNIHERLDIYEKAEEALVFSEEE